MKQALPLPQSQDGDGPGDRPQGLHDCGWVWGEGQVMENKSGNRFSDTDVWKEWRETRMTAPSSSSMVTTSWNLLLHCTTRVPLKVIRSITMAMRRSSTLLSSLVKPQGRMNHCSLERAQQSLGRSLQPSPSEEHPRGTHNKLHTWQQPELVLVLSGLHRAEKDAWSWWTCFHPASSWGHKMFPWKNSWDRCS